MLESDLQSEFTKWMRDGGGLVWLGKRGLNAAAFELKIVHGETLPFSKVEESQVISLAKAALMEGVKPLVYKISDSALGYKPFDCFVMAGCGSYLVVGFNDGKDVFAISIQVFLPWYEKWVRDGRLRSRVTISEAREWGARMREDGKWL